MTDSAPESTCATAISAADPIANYPFGYTAGSLYAAKNPSILDSGFKRFAHWRRDNREKLSTDSLRQAVAAFLDRSEIPQPDAEAWLLSFSAFIPPADDLEAVLHFLDAFYWSVRNSREQVRQSQIRAEVLRQQREAEAAWRRSWPGYKLP